MITLKIVLSLTFLVSGMMMLLADAGTVEQYTQLYDRPMYLYYLLAVMEVFGAIGLFVAEKIHRLLPGIFMGILGLIALDCLFMHLLVQEYRSTLPPAILLFLLLILYIGHRR